MGLLREQGIITGSANIEEWQALGYKATGNWQKDLEVTLIREQYNSPNIISDLSEEDSILFDRFSSRQQCLMGEVSS